MANKHISKETLEQMMDLCEQIINACNNTVRRDKSSEENVNKPHYTVRFPKYLPHKVVINGQLKDRDSLSHSQRDAVQDQKDIDQAKERLKQERMERIAQLRKNN